MLTSVQSRIFLSPFAVYCVKNKIYKSVTLPVVYVSIPEYSAEKYILDMRRRQLKETGKKIA